MRSITWGAAASLALVATAAPAIAQDDAQVSVLHAVPCLTVDVYVNGEGTLPDFEPGTLTETLTLPAGDYDIELYADGDDRESAEPAISAEDLAVPGGANITLTANLDAGSVSADVVLAGTEDVAIGPADLDLAEGTNTTVYAWGSAADGNLDLAVQTIEGLHGDPSGVPSGEGGMLDGGASAWLWVMGLTGVAGALVASRKLSGASA